MARTKTKPGTKADYETPEALEKACAAYFDSLKGTKDKPTVTGMCLFLGFTSREALAHYENKTVADDYMSPEVKAEFHRVVKRAKLRVEASYEQRLHDPACTGAIFALKNFGWQDLRETNVSGSVVHTHFSEPVSETVDWLKEAAGKPAAGEAEEPVLH